MDNSPYICNIKKIILIALAAALVAMTANGQTWWSLYNEAMGYTLEVNDSWGGTTICNTGYFRSNATNSSFNSRLWKLGNRESIIYALMMNVVLLTYVAVIRLARK